MKISEIYHLGKTQYELDFVNIDPDRDTPLFLDPYYISKCDFPFAIQASAAIRSYFEYLLALLRSGAVSQAKELFSHLGENNDICLGLSTGKPRGHGMGPTDTEAIFDELLQSHAIESGIMEDIEDFRIFVPNVDRDKVSDMTANIIKWHLIIYTQEQCKLHGIPLMPSVPSGLYWDTASRTWDNQYTERLVINNQPILLVPKRIVSFNDKYTPHEYRQQFVLSFLQNEHLKIHSGLVQKRKDGTEFVTKKSISEREDKMDKEYLAAFTALHPEVFADFKEKTSRRISQVNGNVCDDIDAAEVCEYLKTKLHQTPSGSEHATDYHNLIVGIPIPQSVRPSVLFLREQAGQFLWDSGVPGQPFDPAHFRRNFQAAVAAVGVRPLTPHSCRHTYVSQLQALGVDMETIQSMVGHADIEMTQHYLHVQEKVRQAAARKLSKSLGPSR